MFTISAEGRVLIRGIEKFEPKYYFDGGGVATVGYGHAIVMNGKQVSTERMTRAQADALATQYMMSKWGRVTISEAEGDALFAEDMKTFEAAVNTICDDKTYQCEYDAMVSLAFNIGAPGFLKSSVAKFHKAGARKVGDISMSTLAAFSKSKAASTNIQQAFAAWSFDNGSWVLGLYRRRLAELLVYRGAKAADARTTAWSFK